LISPVRPDDRERIDQARGIQSKMKAWIDRRLKSTRSHLLEHLFFSALIDDDFRSNAVRISAETLQDYGQIMSRIDRTRTISVNRCGSVDVIHHEIERAAVVQVHINGAIRKAFVAEAPLSGHVGEGQISIIVECVLRDW